MGDLLKTDESQQWEFIVHKQPFMDTVIHIRQL